jgi:hypothetical protein
MMWIDALPANRRRGSYPRCLLLMDAGRDVVAQRLTKLVSIPGVSVSPDDCWMPTGIPALLAPGKWDLGLAQEAKLGEDEGFLSPARRQRVTGWWLDVVAKANTPNWDVASTCRIAGRRGLLLVEAKAHAAELSSGAKPKPSTPNGEKNDRRTRAAMAEANGALNRILPGWRLSCDSHYQMANRFAWAWKLASMGVPVVLAYLGFTQAREMADRGEPFADGTAWEKTVRDYSAAIAPSSVWDNPMRVRDASATCCIRSTEISLPIPSAGGNA